MELEVCRFAVTDPAVPRTLARAIELFKGYFVTHLFHTLSWEYILKGY